MDYFLIIVGAILIIAGILGCFLPVLPGPPISYLGILLLHFTQRAEFSLEFLLFFGIAVLLVQVLDYFVPIWGTKKFGGGSRGAWGSAFGVIAGLFILPPWGIIIFPFLGAVIGELSDGKPLTLAVKGGLGAFLGFLVGVLFKLALSLVLAYFFFKNVAFFIWQALS